MCGRGVMESGACAMPFGSWGWFRAASSSVRSLTSLASFDTSQRFGQCSCRSIEHRPLYTARRTRPQTSRSENKRLQACNSVPLCDTKPSLAPSHLPPVAVSGNQYRKRRRRGLSTHSPACPLPVHWLLALCTRFSCPTPAAVRFGFTLSQGDQ